MVDLNPVPSKYEAGMMTTRPSVSSQPFILWYITYAVEKASLSKHKRKQKQTPGIC